jgi:antirestriction protein ArdC
LIRRLTGPGPFCPTRPQSRGPRAKGHGHEQRTLRCSSAHHRQDRQRDRARRRRLPSALASLRRQHHAPVNVASKKSYRGVNVVALWAYAEESGYSSGIWGTYRQWAESGAQVRKGEKAAYVVFYKELEFAAETETGDADTVTRLFARATPVFAAEQVDGYQPPAIDAPPATVITRIEQAEALVRATCVSIHHGGGRAFYRPATDSIQLPPDEAFHGPEERAVVVLHELAHNAAIRIMPHGLR